MVIKKWHELTNVFFHFIIDYLVFNSDVYSKGMDTMVNLNNWTNVNKGIATTRRKFCRGTVFKVDSSSWWTNALDSEQLWKRNMKHLQWDFYRKHQPFTVKNENKSKYYLILILYIWKSRVTLMEMLKKRKKWQKEKKKWVILKTIINRNNIIRNKKIIIIIRKKMYTSGVNGSLSPGKTWMNNDLLSDKTRSILKSNYGRKNVSINEEKYIVSKWHLERKKKKFAKWDFMLKEWKIQVSDANW